MGSETVGGLSVKGISGGRDTVPPQDVKKSKAAAKAAAIRFIKITLLGMGIPISYHIPARFASARGKIP
jgi:hypothetical protein